MNDDLNTPVNDDHGAMNELGLLHAAADQLGAPHARRVLERIERIERGGQVIGSDSVVPEQGRERRRRAPRRRRMLLVSLPAAAAVSVALTLAVALGPGSGPDTIRRGDNGSGARGIALPQVTLENASAASALKAAAAWSGRGPSNLTGWIANGSAQDAGMVFPSTMANVQMTWRAPDGRRIELAGHYISRRTPTGAVDPSKLAGYPETVRASTIQWSVRGPDSDGVERMLVSTSPTAPIQFAEVLPGEVDPAHNRAYRNVVGSMEWFQAQVDNPDTDLSELITSLPARLDATDQPCSKQMRTCLKGEAWKRMFIIEVARYAYASGLRTARQRRDVLDLLATYASHDSANPVQETRDAAGRRAVVIPLEIGAPSRISRIELLISPKDATLLETRYYTSEGGNDRLPAWNFIQLFQQVQDEPTVVGGGPELAECPTPRVLCHPLKALDGTYEPVSMGGPRMGFPVQTLPGGFPADPSEQMEGYVAALVNYS